MNFLTTHIQHYFGFPPTDLERVAKQFTVQTMKKGEFWLREGQQAHSLSIVQEGYLRVFGYTQDGSKEVTQWVSLPGTFITELASFTFGTPARWDIQALTDCQLYSISKDKFDRLAEIAPSWTRLEAQFLAKCFVNLENRVFQQLSMTAEEKYRALFEQAPEVFNQVPLQYIASMLGMTPETLSRIRRKMIS